MKAIDYSARLFRQALKLDIDLLATAHLCAVAAGLDTAEDIANFLGYSNEQVPNRILTKLTNGGYIGWTDDNFSGLRIYTLLPQGKEAVCSLLSFLPKQAK